MSNMTSETTAIKSAQPDEAAMLKLRTSGPANRAHLQRDGTGRVSLYFRGLYYGVDDYLPNSLFGTRSISPGVTAGEFVCRQMLRDYGYQEDEWPALARRFLITHMSCRADRSRSNR